MTMAIAPNAQTLAYASLPLVQEAGVQVQEIGRQVYISQQMYKEECRI